MKRTLIALLFCPLAANAVVTATTTPGLWDLYLSTSKVSTHATEVACVAAAVARDVVATYTCRTRTSVVTALVPPPPPPPPPPDTTWVSLWNDAATPAAEGATEPAVTLGVRFVPSVAGVITGVRFYKYAGNSGAHVGNIWSTAGVKLGTVNFVAETASGWQQATFAAPIAIAAGTPYIASYHTTVGHYGYNLNYFSATYANGTLSAPASTTAAPNGVYRYGTTPTFPNLTWMLSNYWVDVVFVPAVLPPPPVTYSVVVAASSGGTVTGGGINCGTTCSGTYNAGTSLTLTATPASGYTFSGWGGACAGTSTCTLTVDAAKSVSASFALLPPPPPPVLTGTAALTWTASPNTTVTGYRVYYGFAPSTYLQASGMGLAVANTTSYSLAGLEAGRLYYFAVTAIDGLGNESVYSNEATKLMPP